MKWSDLFSRVMPHVPGCPEMMVEDALRDTAIKFCRDSHLWREQIMDLYLSPGIHRYELDLPEQTEVAALICAWQRKPGSEHKEAVHPDINVFRMVRFDTLPDPDKGPIELHVVLQPTLDADGMLDAIGLDYDQALIHGALERLVIIPGKDWSNPNMATYHRSKYLESLTDARLAKANGNTEAPLRVSPQPFF
ncbi:hypothetical protein [Marinobacter sp. OP 3.4]|uniref:hypothetical protein n=1 Tax=Marinobacter sp. OP 3.4 TaxID=3076501 RepID=UPI002E20FF19